MITVFQLAVFKGTSNFHFFLGFIPCGNASDIFGRPGGGGPGNLIPNGGGGGGGPPNIPALISKSKN